MTQPSGQSVAMMQCTCEHRCCHIGQVQSTLLTPPLWSLQYPPETRAADNGPPAIWQSHQNRRVATGHFQQWQSMHSVIPAWPEQCDHNALNGANPKLARCSTILDAKARLDAGIRNWQNWLGCTLACSWRANFCCRVPQLASRVVGK